MGDRHVLVIEDEKDLAQLLDVHLRDINCEVTLATDGHAGMRLGLAKNRDLIILDLHLPGRDGLSICRAVRRDMPYAPILILTARTSEIDRVLGLELGADDYVTKPFSVAELMAQVKAIFRRGDSFPSSFSDAGNAVTVGPLKINIARQEVLINHKPVSLTSREFDLLTHFVRHPGRVFSRAQLLDSVWGFGHDGFEHTVNSHINRLRAKIEPNVSSPTLIVTVWRVGYKLGVQPQTSLERTSHHP